MPTRRPPRANRPGEQSQLSSGDRGNAAAGIILSTAAGAGQGALLGGPAGAITGAVLGAGTALIEHIFGQDPEPLKRSQKVIRSAIEEAKWVVGDAKISGTLVYYNEVDIPAGGELDPSSDLRATYAGIRAEMAIVLSENELSRISRIWIDGDEMPIGGSTNVKVFNPSGFDSEIATLRAELATLGVATEDVDTIIDSATATPLAVDIATRIKELENLQNNVVWTGTNYDVTTLVSTDVSLVSIWFDLGGAGVSVADTRAHLRRGRKAKARTAGDDDVDVPTVGQWDGTANQLEGLAWMWVELLSFAPDPGDDTTDRFRVWKQLPNIQVLAHSARGSNPADWIEWYLTDRCRVDAADITGVSTARTVCAENVVIAPVVRGDDTVDDKLVYADDVLATLFPDGLPTSTTVQDNALALWNSRYAGSANAEARYQVHGVITSTMLQEPYRLLRELGEAMGGWVVTVGNQYRLVAGTASAPVATITEDDVVDDFISWVLGPSHEERISGIRALLPQDRRHDYEPLDMGDAVRPDLANVAGYRVLDIGAIPFQSSEICARRLVNLLLRRRDPGLRHGTCILSRGGTTWDHWDLAAGDRVTLNLSYENVSGIILLESVEPSPDGGRVAITFREDPDTVYSDSFDLLPVGTAPAKFRTTRIGVVQRPGTVAVTVANDRAAPTFSITYGAGFESLLIEVPVEPDPLPDDYDPANGGPTGLPLVPAPADSEVVARKTIDIADSAAGRATYTVSVDALDGPDDMTAGEPEAELDRGEERGEYRIYALVRANDANTARWAYSGVLRGLPTDTMPGLVVWDSVAENEITLPILGAAKGIRITNARATGSATLVWRLNDDDWNEIDDAALPITGMYTPANLSPAIFRDNEDDVGYTFSMARLSIDQAAAYLTLAARTGEGTEDSPYDYLDAKTVGFTERPTQLSEANVIVTELPATSTLPEGTLYHVLEETTP